MTRWRFRRLCQHHGEFHLIFYKCIWLYYTIYVKCVRLCILSVFWQPQPTCCLWFWWCTLLSGDWKSTSVHYNSTILCIHSIALKFALKLKCTCLWHGCCSVLTRALISASRRTDVHPLLRPQEADTNNRGKTGHKIKVKFLTTDGQQICHKT